jgi:protein-tyrosine phosphatase
VIDLHCHVLAGLDDGPRTPEDSVAMARAAAAAGTRTIVATPHVSSRYTNDAAAIAGVVRELNAALALADVPVSVLPGAEVAITSVSELDPAELSALSLGGRGTWLLIEPPFTSVAVGLDALVWELQDRGHRVVLAHPERCAAFQRDRRLLASLVESGVVTSITAGSLVGRFGRSVRRFARELLDAELVHNVSSDAHDYRQRPPSVLSELERAGLSPMSDWLTSAVPAAIIDGAHSIPPPPALSRSTLETTPGRWWRRPAFTRPAR